MKGICAILVSCFVVAIVASAALTSSAAAGPGKTPLDPTKPETWHPAVERAQGRLREVAKDLISVAKDHKHPAELRRKAILLLGGIAHPDSARFLIANVSERIPLTTPGVIIGDDQRIPLEMPFRTALGRGNWAAAQAILESMAQEKTRTDLIHLASALESILNRDDALAILDVQLRRRLADVRRKNLDQLKDFISR